MVLQAGTFSKIFCPGFRLGWAAGPAEIIARLVVAKQNSDQCSAALGQRMLEAHGRSAMMEPQGDACRAHHARAAARAPHARALPLPRRPKSSAPPSSR